MYVEKTKNLLSFADVPKEMAKEKKKGSSGPGRVSVGSNDIRCWGEASMDDVISVKSSSARKEAIWMILSMMILMRTCR